MKILFIANPHLNLYCDIVEELERRNHTVAVIEDKRLKYDPYYSCPFWYRIIKYILFLILNIPTRYWKHKIKEDSRLSESYDVLLALSGVSVNKYIIRHLHFINPKIKTILYTWDSCSYYDYSRLLHYFDKCYTFDICDSIKDQRWNLLPIYFKKQSVGISGEYRYDLFSVGTNHDGRYSLYKKIIPQLKSYDLNYYIKLVCISDSNIIVDDLGVKTNTTISKKEYDANMKYSRCVLDDQREGQSGLTARFIWALANGKKIITTNKWAMQYSFVNPKQIFIIDVKDPLIPLDFLKRNISNEELSDVAFLRIDNWINELFS